jgi:hypothetical protein
LLAGDHGERAKQFLLGFGLEQVTLRADAKCAAKNLDGLMQSEEKDLDAGLRSVNYPRGFQPVQAGHGNVHDDHVGVEIRGHADGRNSVFRLTAKFPPRTGMQDRLDSPPDESVVVYDQNLGHVLDRTCTSLQLCARELSMEQTQKLVGKYTPPGAET